MLYRPMVNRQQLIYYLKWTVSEYLCLSAVHVSDKITLVKLLGKIPSLVCPLLLPKTL